MFYSNPANPKISLSDEHNPSRISPSPFSGLKPEKSEVKGVELDLTDDVKASNLYCMCLESCFESVLMCDNCT